MNIALVRGANQVRIRINPYLESHPMNQMTVLHRLFEWSEETPNAPSQRYRRNGQWVELSAREYRDRVFHFAVFLESRGFTAADSACIFSYNSAEWAHFHLAVMLIRMKTAGLYPNATAKDCHYILEHTECSAFAVQNKAYWDKSSVAGSGHPEKIRLIIVFEGDSSFSPKAVSYADAIAEGKRLAGGKSFRDYLDRIHATDPAFIVYTSGTTGTPKGALISHDNLAFVTDAMTARWKLPFADGALFSFLPLCHVAEQIHSIGVALSRRYLVNYCSAFENVSKEISEVAPTLLLCVPRVWEKMMEGVVHKLEKAGGVSRALAKWAFAVGAENSRTRRIGKGLSPAASVRGKIAERVIFAKVKKALGLYRAKIVASGAAPLPGHVSEWFRSIGIDIYDTYGATEAGIMCATVPGEKSDGTVGRALDGSQVRLADDGEICSKGRNIFLGYFKDEAQTRGVLVDGWYHTGDLGAMTPEGHLRIVGRKKEIMKTSGGKMIAPVPIEERLKEAAMISQVCLVGDNRKFVSALVTLSESVLEEIRAENKAVKHGLVVDSAILSQVEREVARVNGNLAGFEQVKKFSVIDREFSIADGEMTPTLKMTRRVIEEKFKAIVDRMYAGP